MPIKHLNLQVRSAAKLVLIIVSALVIVYLAFELGSSGGGESYPDYGTRLAPTVFLLAVFGISIVLMGEFRYDKFVTDIAQRGCVVNGQSWFPGATVSGAVRITISAIVIVALVVFPYYVDGLRSPGATVLPAIVVAMWAASWVDRAFARQLGSLVLHPMLAHASAAMQPRVDA